MEQKAKNELVEKLKDMVSSIEGVVLVELEDEEDIIAERGGVTQKDTEFIDISCEVDTKVRDVNLDQVMKEVVEGVANNIRTVRLVIKDRWDLMVEVRGIMAGDGYVKARVCSWTMRKLE